MIKPTVTIKSHRGYVDHCPCCGYDVDTATSVGFTGGTPKPGSLSICMKCGELLKFNSELKLEMFPLKELLTVTPEQMKLIDILREAVQRTKQQPEP